jgi:glycolate oxidase iron-sulfur subunit
MQDLTFSDVNRDTADVLLANHCSVHTPPVQPCCGSLHGHNGETELAARLARRMIDLMPPENFDAIITNAGGCGAHLRHYHNLLADDPQYAERAREWDRKIRDIHEWLIQINFRPPHAAPAETPLHVTYHESCHLAHGQKITQQPRELLRSIPGVILTELPESNWCCGSAGVYSITQPEQSANLLDRKVKHILATGADVLATSNPGCHLQIAAGLECAGSTITLIQPITLLARAYRNEKKIPITS